jgi:hypothetical protein
VTGFDSGQGQGLFSFPEHFLPSLSTNYFHIIYFHSTYFSRRGILPVLEVSVVAWQQQEEWRSEIFHIHSTMNLKRAKVFMDSSFPILVM